MANWPGTCRQSNDDAGLDRILPITARSSSVQLKLSEYLLWLAQETPEKNTPKVLLQHLSHEPKQMFAQSKLSAGSLCRDRQDAIDIGVIVGPASACQAR